jgi:hypothetical protein
MSLSSISKVERKITMVSNKFLDELNDYCNTLNKDEISGIWLLSKKSEDEEPRIVIASCYAADSLEFLKIEGHISKIFTNEAKRNNPDDYVGGAIVYHLDEDIKKGLPTQESSVSLNEELAGATMLYNK